MMAISSGCGLCPWSCSGKVGAYAGIRNHMSLRHNDTGTKVALKSQPLSNSQRFFLLFI